MGVVRRGGAHITCSVKRNRSKSHIILTTPPNPPRSNNNNFSHGHQSLALMAEGIYNTSSVVPSRQMQLFLSQSRVHDRKPYSSPFSFCVDANGYPAQHLLALLGPSKVCPPTPTHLGCSRTPLLSAKPPITTWSRARASASAWLPDFQPWHQLPHTSLAVTRSSLRSHSTSRLRAMALASPFTRFPAAAPFSPFLGGRTLWRWLPPHLLDGRALPRLLPHTLSTGSRSGDGCHTPSRRARALALAAIPPAQQLRAPVFAATPSRRTHALAFAATPSHRARALPLAAFPPLQQLPLRCHLNLTIPRLISTNGCIVFLLLTLFALCLSIS